MSPFLRSAALRAYGTLLPGHAADWFERVLMTPRPMPAMDIRAPNIPKATHRFPYGWGWTTVTEWGVRGPAVLLVHGWGGSAESMLAFVEPLVAAGCRAVAVDLPAHGASGGGPRTNLIECAGAVLQVGQTFAPLAGIITHSFGGPVSALAHRHGLQAEHTAMLAPPLSIRDLALPMGDWLGLPRRVSERALDGFARRLDVAWDELRTDRLVERLDLPLLVVHDEDDKVVPWSHGIAVARAAPRGSLRTTAGLGHRDILIDPTVVGEVVRLVASSPIAATPQIA